MASEPHSISDTVEVSFQIACPCGQVLTVGPTMVGQAVRCPRCATLLEVPAPDESALVAQPPSPEVKSDGHWRIPEPPKRDNFIDEELKRDADKQAPPEPEKREPIDPTPLLAVLGGTVLVLMLVGLGFYALDQYIDEIKEQSSAPTKVESKQRTPADAPAKKAGDASR
jgi:hypothetical protein